MEKPKSKKLRSSMKSIQEAIASFIRMARIFIHQTRTPSFRDFYPTPSFDSIYYTSPSHSSATTTSSSSSHHHRHLLPTSTSYFGRKYEKTPISVLPVDTCVSSRRFFFSPRTTKSIMEEQNLHLGHRKVISLDDPPDRHLPEPVACAGSGGDCFCEDSVHMVMKSEEPYRDFRVSMEEMVLAHGLRDWSRLQQLLQCYLRLNDKKTHPIIMLAFIDLLVHFHNGNNSSLSYFSPLL